MSKKLLSSLIILGAIFSSAPTSVLADSSVLNIETKATTVDVTVRGQQLLSSMLMEQTQHLATLFFRIKARLQESICLALN